MLLTVGAEQKGGGSGKGRHGWGAGLSLGAAGWLGAASLETHQWTKKEDS